MAGQISLLMTFLLSVAVQAQNSIPVLYNDVDIPDGCRGLQAGSTSGGENYCPESPSNYPQEWIDSYVKQWDKIMVPNQQSNSRAANVVRDQYVPDPSCDSSDNNCCTESATIMPFLLKTENNMMLVIQPTFFQQTIKATRCVSEGSECLPDLGLYGVEPRCVTEMGTTKLLVFNSRTNTTEMRDMHFPVGCSCHVQVSK